MMKNPTNSSNLTCNDRLLLEIFANEEHDLPMILICWSIAIVGVVLNVVTCTVIIRNESMHTVTNFYLINLAIADLMMLFFQFPTHHLFQTNCVLR